MHNIRQKIDTALSITELVQGVFKQEECGRIVLSMIILRRFNCILHKIDLGELVNGSPNAAESLSEYIKTFPRTIYDIMKYLGFVSNVLRMEHNGLLHEVIEVLNSIDLHSNKVSNIEMVYLFRELTKINLMDFASDGYTHEEVVRLMVNLLFLADEQKLLEEAYSLGENILTNLGKVMETS